MPPVSNANATATETTNNDFDRGPLSFVIKEITGALNQSQTALTIALELSKAASAKSANPDDDADAGKVALRRAKSFLHQAHGALQLVDVEGVAILTETIDEVFDRVDSAQLPLSVAIVDAVAHAYHALTEYLQELLAGALPQPTRLFPYYQDLLQARGADKILPADLFFPNLAIASDLPASANLSHSTESSGVKDYAELRKRFERALLAYLKGTHAALREDETMHAILGEVERAQTNLQSRRLWWVLKEFSAAVTTGAIRNELNVKQLFARINVQLRRLSEGSSNITERLLRDALFFIAQVEEPTLNLAEIRSAYQLDTQSALDLQERHYGTINQVLLTTARARLKQAKNLWDRIANGDAKSAGNFENEMSSLCDAASALNVAALEKLLRELKGIARAAAYAKPGDRLGLEMATSLLFIENALNQLSRLPADFVQRADELSARLLSCIANEDNQVDEKPVPWLDDMAKQVQDQQSMTTLQSELQASMAQVEKNLEQYFADPTQPAVLAPVDAILHQIGGAFSVMDQEHASQAIASTRQALNAFAQADTPIDPMQAQPRFHQIARNIGALGFFIETLHMTGNQRNQFSFDETTGIFQANLLRNAKARDSNDVRDSLIEESDAVTDLNNEVDVSSNDLAAVDVIAIDLPSTDAGQLGTPAGDVDTQSASTLVNDAASGSDLDTDAELLDIFLQEATEVLQDVRTILPAAREAPTQVDYLTMMRRSFHTLKGSGRMVGLDAIGDAAWSIEKVLNQRFSESRSGDPDLFALLEMALTTLSEWVDDLRCKGTSERTSEALIAAAGRIESGLPFEQVVTDPIADSTAIEVISEEQQQPTIVIPSESIQSVPTLPTLPTLPTQPLQTIEATQIDTKQIDTTQIDISEEESSAENTVINRAVIGFPTTQPPRNERNDGTRHIGPIEISVALHNIYLAETDTLVRTLSHDLDEWRHEPERPVNTIALHAAHSLAGTSATVGFKALQQLTQTLEAVLQQLARSPVILLASEFDLLDAVTERIRFMLQLFALGELAEPEPEKIQALELMRAEISARAEAQERTPSEPTLAMLLSKESAESKQPIIDSGEQTDTGANINVVPSSVPVIAPVLAVPFVKNEHEVSEHSVPLSTLALHDELDVDLLPIFIEEANDMLPEMGRLLRSWQHTPSDGAIPQALLRLLHTIKGSARMAGAMRLGQHMHDMESRIEQGMHSDHIAAPLMDDLFSRLDHGNHMFDALQNPQGSNSPNQPQVATVSPSLPAVEIAPEQTNQPIRKSRKSASAVSQSAALAKQRLLASQQLDTQPPPIARRLRADAAPAPTPAPPVPLVRVRADVLDRLVNQAGEVSISRSKMENEVTTMRHSLVELTENLSRLQEQLREVEMQAESQIENQNQISRQTSSAADKQFDPLEFDRYTRLQELTRMMAESVSDVSSVQQQLTRTLDSASNDLGLQARLTRDLQQDLMSVRMVQFGSITERLYRVTRQASKETDKRVNLDIRGSMVEVDRSVLEKMAGPFEHLLRNAIVHGIESRADRITAGKAETGELLIEVRQDGNEVVIQFSDDGQGLNLERIRHKATQIGLLDNAHPVTDEEATDLIFHPGFSTALTVTELAGRGVGMDVVRAEAAALGGRVAIMSHPGQGAQFTVHLPLTLAVTQVVLLTTGGRTYAVPSVLVEQVQQLKTPALTAAYNEGAVSWQSQRVPMIYLASLLGDKSNAVTQQYSPLVLLKSGSHRIAIHVDEIIGNREVVVKNIGPQLARLAGIVGATVLGSGEVVLILNPISLMQQAAADHPRLPRIPGSPADELDGAVAEFGHGTSLATQPVTGLRAQQIVMVVDDSLTVRRVTQRLLSREGYQVVLAKDGVDALEQLQSVTPDMMLVDIEMPRMDGFDLTRNVRDDERTREIPIIMITSRTAAKHRNYAFELGINEYVGKPYQEEVLLSLIAKFINTNATIEDK
jgi:chemosensory pili system protein ChpA (sensor histidine kinase/response regulator)